MILIKDIDRLNDARQEGSRYWFCKNSQNVQRLKFAPEKAVIFLQ